METVVAQLDIFRGKIIHIMTNISWRTEAKAEIITVAILWYIVLLLVLLYIHRKLLKRQKKLHEHLVLLYDTIRYQVAKAQYSNPAIQDNKGIKIVIESEHENYPANAKAIKEEILSIEQKLWQQIISTEQRKVINKQTKKKHNVSIFVQLIGRCTTLITAGFYKLFW